MKQGELLKKYATDKGLSVAQLGRDLNKDRSGIYALYRTKTFTEGVYNYITRVYPEFKEYINSVEVNEEILMNTKAGYSKNPVALNEAGQTILMKLAVGNSFATLDLLAQLVSQVKGKPIEEVKKEAETIARERLRIVEDTLFGLISS